MSNIIRTLLLCSLMMTAQAVTSLASDKDPEALFYKAIELIEAGDCSGALPLLKEALKEAPSEPATLWNAVICSKKTSDFEAAASFLHRFLDVDPDYFPGWENLVQIYQALGDLKRRDEAREFLIAFRKASKNPKTQDQKMFSREWFTANDQEVYGLEYFDLEGEAALRYVFLVMNPDGKLAYRISLGSYEMINRIERERGTLPDGVRLFHLDAYRGKSHWTLGFYEGEPSYDDIRPLVGKIVEAGGPESFAISSSHQPE